MKLYGEDYFIDTREGYVHREGKDRLNRLHGSLIADKRFEYLERSISDKEYREQLYMEYEIKNQPDSEGSESLS